MSDIVDQMTREMKLTTQQLDSMQQQQYNPNGNQGMPGMPDFSQMTPQQQMMMMNQMEQQQQMMQQQAQMQQPNYDSDSESDSSDSSSDDSAEMNLDKLGLNGQPNGLMDTIMHYLRDPILVMILVMILSLSQFDSTIKPLLPAMLSTGMYYVGIKGTLAGVIFGLLKLVLV